MKPVLQRLLVEHAPLLYKHFADSPQTKIDCPDDLFELIFDLSRQIEDFNRRFPKRRVRALKVAMVRGELHFITQRAPFSIRKRIAGTAARIRARRRELRNRLVERAKTIPTVPLFGSCLLPDWRRWMPDDRETLRGILAWAEKRAVVPQDFLDLAHWYRRLLDDEECSRRLCALGAAAERKGGGPR